MDIYQKMPKIEGRTACAALPSIFVNLPVAAGEEIAFLKVVEGHVKLADRLFRIAGSHKFITANIHAYKFYSVGIAGPEEDHITGL